MAEVRLRRARGPTRAICLSEDDRLWAESPGRGLAYTAIRLMIGTMVSGSGMRTVVLDIEEGNLPSIRLAERLGAERRSPTRVRPDRFGAPHTMVVYVLTLAS